MRRAAVLSVVAVLGGCAVDLDRDNEPAGVVAIEFASQSAWIALTTTGASVSIDMGTTSGRTCFLAGVAGNLTTLRGGHVTIAVEKSNGNYHLHVSGEQLIKAWARCVPVVGMAEVDWSGATVQLAPDVEGRGCYLTKLDLDGPAQGPGPFEEPSDILNISRNNGSWNLSGDFSSFGHPAASARCVDGTESDGTYLVNAPPNNFSITGMTTVSGATCGLQKLRGAFVANDAGDGVFITHDDFLGFMIEATNDKGGKATCVK